MDVEKPTPVWPRDLLEEQVEHLAAKTSRLLADETRWVHRRVETIRFLDEARFERRSSVDFTVPRFEPSPGDPPSVALRLVPLALVQKGVLRNLDVRGEYAEALPVLTRDENARIAGTLLVQQAAVALEESGEPGPLLPEVERRLHAVAGARAPRPRLETEEARRQWDLLLRDALVSGLLEDFESQFILFVPLAGEAGSRRVLKFAYEETLRLGRRNPLAERVLNVLESLGLRSFRAGFGLPAFLDAESYHVEVLAPEELVVSSARLVRVQEVVDERSGTVTEEEVVLDTDRDVARAHLYASEQHPTETSWGLVRVFFDLRPALLWPVFLVSAVTTAIFVAGLSLHAAGVAARGGVAAALIVALPGFFAPAIAPSGHRLVRRMFTGLRALVWVSALLSFGAAATLAVDLSQRTTRSAWVGLAVASALLTALAASSLLRSGLRRVRRPADG